MKASTELKYWIIMLFLLLTATFILTGCKSQKPTIQEQNSTKDSSRNVIEIDYKKEINKAVADSIAKFLPTIKTGNKNCDSICNEKCNELLAQANFYKKSGENNYKLYFDKEKRLLSFVANLESTISELQSKKEIKERFFVRNIKITKTVKEKYIPFWVKVLAWIGGISTLFLTYRFSKIFRP